MSVDLERQLRAYATRVVEQSEPASFDSAIVGDTTHRVETRRGPWVAALAFAVVVLVGVVAWLLVQRPAEVDTPDLTTTTIPATTTTLPAAAGDTTAAVVVGNAESAGWTWAPVDDRIDSAAPQGGASSVLGQLEDGTLVGLNAPRHRDSSPDDAVRGSGFMCNACSLLLFDGSEWREQSLPQFDGLLLDDLWVQEGLLWAWVEVDPADVTPLAGRALFVSEDGQEWDETVLDWSGFMDPTPWAWLMLRLGDTVVAIESEVQSSNTGIGDLTVVTGTRAEVFLSPDRGRRFTKLTDFPVDGSLSVRRAWMADGMFHMVVSSEQDDLVLLRSRNGLAWTSAGDVSGLSRSEGEWVDYLSPGPLVVTAPGGSLVAASLWPTANHESLQRSEDGGLSWVNLSGPFPFEEAEVKGNGGWLLAADPCPDQCGPDRNVWVTRDAMTWFSLGRVLFVESLYHPFATGAIIRETEDGLEVAIPPSS